MASSQTVILHVDMDAFYASVEQRDNPDYQGKPVIVGARPGSRGVVSAASYEARRFGIHSAMPINRAYEKCPGGIFLPPRMELYVKVSRRIMDIFHSFSPDVEPISIDEAFIDITGTRKLWGDPLKTAKLIKGKIRNTLHLTASIGIAPNKFLAKVASDMDKPDGITTVPFDRGAIVEWLAPLPVNKIWGIGIKTGQILSGMGVKSVRDIHQYSLNALTRRFGKHGIGLYYLSRGIDSRKVEEGEPAKSISREHTFSSDVANRQIWEKTLLRLSRDVAQRVRKKRLRGCTVVFTFRLPDFHKHTRRVKLDKPTCLAKVLFDAVRQLMRQNLGGVDKLRLIGVGLTDFTEFFQPSFFDIFDNTRTQEDTEKAMDAIRDKFGQRAIFFGGET